MQSQPSPHSPKKWAWLNNRQIKNGSENFIFLNFHVRWPFIWSEKPLKFMPLHFCWLKNWLQMVCLVLAFFYFSTFKSPFKTFWHANFMLPCLPISCTFICSSDLETVFCYQNCSDILWEKNVLKPNYF